MQSASKNLPPALTPLLLMGSHDLLHQDGASASLELLHSFLSDPQALVDVGRIRHARALLKDGVLATEKREELSKAAVSLVDVTPLAEDARCGVPRPNDHDH